MVIFYLWFGLIDWSVIICGIVLLLLVHFYILATLVENPKYAFSNLSIVLYFFGIKYKEIPYDSFSCICISNAAINNGYGYCASENMLMTFKQKDDRGVHRVAYPFLTLHSAGCPQIKATMNSRHLFMLDQDNIVCLGICWIDALAELLSHTNVPIYVLEDVYARNRESLDAIFARYDKSFIYIVDSLGEKYRST